MGNLVSAFLRTPDRPTLCAHLSGDLPLKPSLAYVKYASLLSARTDEMMPSIRDGHVVGRHIRDMLLEV